MPQGCGGCGSRQIMQICTAASCQMPWCTKKIQVGYSNWYTTKKCCMKSYFTPNHKKMNWPTQWNKNCAAHDGRVGFNTIFESKHGFSVFWMATFSVAWYETIYFWMINRKTSKISKKTFKKTNNGRAFTLYLLTLRSWFITDIYQNKSLC